MPEKEQPDTDEDWSPFGWRVVAIVSQVETPAESHSSRSQIQRMAQFQTRTAHRLRIRTFQRAPYFKLRSFAFAPEFLTAILMIATAPADSRSAAPRMMFEHLLLGDLRELLNDQPSHERDRWLLATLDILLVSRRRTAPVYLPTAPREPDVGGGVGPVDLPIPFETLQRLRDRIAHRSPYDALARELDVDLREYFEGAQSRRETTVLLH